MNVCPIKLAAVESQTVVKPEENYKKYAMKDAPVPPKDEVSFGAYFPGKSYDRYIGQYATAFIENGVALRKAWSTLVQYLDDYADKGFVKKVNKDNVLNYDNFMRLFKYADPSESTFGLLEGKIPQFQKWEKQQDIDMLETFAHRLSRRKTVVLAESPDGVPVLTLRSCKKKGYVSPGLNQVKRNKMGFYPNNFEVEYKSPAGNMGCTFGINDLGELTLKQTNMGVPRYTAYGRDSILEYYPKIVIEGKNAQFFNEDGSLNWFKSLLLRLCTKN